MAEGRRRQCVAMLEAGWAQFNQEYFQQRIEIATKELAYLTDRFNSIVVTASVVVCAQRLEPGEFSYRKDPAIIPAMTGGIRVHSAGRARDRARDARRAAPIRLALDGGGVLREHRLHDRLQPVHHHHRNVEQCASTAHGASRARRPICDQERAPSKPRLHAWHDWRWRHADARAISSRSWRRRRRCPACYQRAAQRPAVPAVGFWRWPLDLYRGRHGDGVDQDGGGPPRGTCRPEPGRLSRNCRLCGAAPCDMRRQYVAAPALFCPPLPRVDPRSVACCAAGHVRSARAAQSLN